MALAVAPSSKTRRRKVPLRSVCRTPGRRVSRVASMANSVIRWAARMHETSSGVLVTLAGPRTSRASDQA